MLVTVAAVAILVATLWLPVLQIYGTSMTPTMVNGDIVFSLKTDQFQQGDVVAFYYNNNNNFTKEAFYGNHPLRTYQFNCQ